VNDLRPALHIIVSAKLELHPITRTENCIPSRSGQVTPLCAGRLAAEHCQNGCWPACSGSGYKHGRCCELNRYRQHKSASVVGVLAEQVGMGQIAFLLLLICD